MTNISGGRLDANGIMTAVRFQYRTTIEIDLRRTSFVSPTGMVFLGTIMARAQESGTECVLLLTPGSEVARYVDRLGLTRQAARCDVKRTRVQAVTHRDPDDRFIELTHFDTHGDTVATDLDRILHSRIRAWEIDKQRLVFAINELASNVENHAGRPGLVCVQHYKNKVEFAVGDHGRGIRASLTAAGYDVDDDATAIATAIQPGVSGTGDSFRGKGLPGLIARTTQVEGGWCAIQSGRHRYWYAHNQEPASYALDHPTPGTLVCGGFTTARSSQ